MTITVIPAYRVISKFAKQAKGRPFEEGVDYLERNLREYVRNLLSKLHPSIMELGERSAVTQLGDPDPESLIAALEAVEEGFPKSVAEASLSRCAEVLPRPDLQSRVVLLPGDGDSKVLVQQMKGVLGFSLGAQTMMVFLWPVDDWQESLTYTIAHEYAHLVRNLMFPRGISGGKLVFMKTSEPETLRDAMITEGVADHFAESLYPDIGPVWTDPLVAEGVENLWPRVHRRMGVSDMMEIRRVLFGDNDRLPAWTGYAFGHRIVRSYLDTHADATPASLIGIPASTIFDDSGFEP